MGAARNVSIRVGRMWHISGAIAQLRLHSRPRRLSSAGLHHIPPAPLNCYRESTPHAYCLSLLHARRLVDQALSSAIRHSTSRAPTCQFVRLSPSKIFLSRRELILTYALWPLRPLTSPHLYKTHRVGSSPARRICCTCALLALLACVTLRITPVATSRG